MCVNVLPDLDKRAQPGSPQRREPATSRSLLADTNPCGCNTGILVYNGLVDLIIPTFSDRDMPQQWWMQALGFGSLFTGAGVMSLIAKWA